MPCPHFFPLRPFGPGPWDPAPRLPLNQAWQGECHAATPFSPPESEQRELCNLGYARGICPHFPATTAADAVRFSGVSSAGGQRLIFILEKEHAPLKYGTMATDGANALLSAQAEAFRQSQNGRKG